MKLRSVQFAIAALAIAGGLFTASCNKVEETVATITVLNTFGSPVQGADVRLFAVGSVDNDVVGQIRFDTLQVTNGAGKVSFNFSEYYKRGQAGFAVLDINASKGSLEGRGIIKIVEEETNEATVVIE
ncbi:MAG: hypothetical protein ACFCUH_00950 [Flavobacteriales bacterium]